MSPYHIISTACRAAANYTQQGRFNPFVPQRMSTRKYGGTGIAIYMNYHNVIWRAGGRIYLCITGE